MLNTSKEMSVIRHKCHIKTQNECDSIELIQISGRFWSVIGLK